jgi:outer membrane lipoprotein carrier protein
MPPGCTRHGRAFEFPQQLCRNTRCYTEDMARLLAVLVVLTIGSATAGAQARPPAEELARSLQQRYAKIRDFSADFVHSYRGGALRTQVTERGTMAIKKPGKMRWNYTSPERKTFVSDGVKIYSYIPQDRQVIVSDVPTAEEATTAVMFLAGKGDIVRDFTPSYAEGGPRGAWSLKLVPRKAERDYDTLVLALDAATLQIKALTTTDRQGGESTFTFTSMKENRGLSDKEFAFRIPRGVDVISDGRVSR